MARLTDKGWLLADDLITWLAYLDTDRPRREWTDDVIEKFRGVPYSVFSDLDVNPGGHWPWEREGMEWHWKLRKTRNTRAELIAGLNTKEVPDDG